MRARLILVGMLAMVTVLPMTGAGATHCSTQIYLFSYRSAPVTDPTDPNRQQGTPTIVPSAVGCIVIGDDIPETPGDDSNTDYIYPGSDTLVARWIGGGIPVSGTLEFAGNTYTLRFYSTSNGVVTVSDSKQVFVDPVSTVNGGTARVTVCPDGDPANCQTREYRTVA